MKHKTVKSLRLLSKLRRLEMLEKQQALAEMQAKLQTLNQKVKDIAKLREDEIECCRTDPASGVHLQNYLESLRIKENVLKRQIYTLADFMIPVQDSVRESFKQVKSLEISMEKLQNQIQYDDDKKEQDFLDEISLQNKARQNND